jgi:hypothetical protein
MNLTIHYYVRSWMSIAIAIAMWSRQTIGTPSASPGPADDERGPAAPTNGNCGRWASHGAPLAGDFL